MMNKDWIKLRNRFSNEYIEGVEQFLKVAKCHVNGMGKTRCPCKVCMNSKAQSLDAVERHLFSNGMSPSYSQWIYHGEPANLARFQKDTSSLVDVDLNGDFNYQNDDDNNMLSLINDLQGAMIAEEEENMVDDEEFFGDEMSANVEESNSSNNFENLMAAARKELYPGCTKFSSLDFLVKLMHIKVLNRWSNKSFDMLLELLKEAFPTGASIPGTFYQAKRKLRDLGLGYDKIDVCKYDCALFWKEYEGCQSCPVCGEPRRSPNPHFPFLQASK